MSRIYIILVVAIVAIILVYWVLSYGEWHESRNHNNINPTGMLKLVIENEYVDEVGLIWKLQPHSKNIFHQPDLTPVPVPPIRIPYPNVDPPLVYNPDYPNLKFLSLGPDGDSYEAILQPDGTFLLTGSKQGTYNYGHPSGFWGYTKHIFLDVIPHLFNSNYVTE